MAWLITVGIISLVFGIVLLFFRKFSFHLANTWDKPLASFDDKLKSVRLLTGVVLILLSSWIILVSYYYAQLWYLHIVGSIVLFFGLLYLLMPQVLDLLSNISSRVVYSTDEALSKTGKVLGVILILSAGYFFYTAALVRK